MLGKLYYESKIDSSIILGISKHTTKTNQSADISTYLIIGVSRT